MLTILIFAVAAYMLYRQLGLMTDRSSKKVVPTKTASPRLVQALGYAARLLKEKKFLQAEKAYLQVLKLDHQNTVAYTQLGVIYSRQRNYEDAKECFEIAAQLNPSAVSWHNLGLVYFESRNFIKASAAFEKAIMFEPLATRYLDLAKVYGKLANPAKAIAALEKAAELEPTKDHLILLAGAYKSSREVQKAESTWRRIVHLDPTDSRARRELESVASPKLETKPS